MVKAYSLTHSSWHVCVDVTSRTIRLNTPLFWASLPASEVLICSHFFMSSVHRLVGRPFLLLPSSLACNMYLSTHTVKHNNFHMRLSLVLFRGCEFRIACAVNYYLFFSSLFHTISLTFFLPLHLP